MPIFNAEVQNSQSVWKSPDGQREIFEVNLLVNGKAVTAKTYSNDIAQAGFSGELESYEKPVFWKVNASVLDPSTVKNSFASNFS